MRFSFTFPALAVSCHSEQSEESLSGLCVLLPCPPFCPRRAAHRVSLIQQTASEGATVKPYVFRVVLEPDEDAWRAFIPELEAQGAATWGHTKEEALRNIQEVAQMVIGSLLEGGESWTHARRQ
jgi:predicted RNase H-like HicB family nuclease